MLKIVNINGKNCISLNNEVFDWDIDLNQILTVKSKVKNDPAMRETFIGSILKHFVDCFSEFIGKKVTLQEINAALKKGQI